MKAYQFRISTLVATTVLAAAIGCNKEVEYTPVATDTPMAISVSVAQEATASKAALRDGAFTDGEQLGLYVVAWRKPSLPGVLEHQYNYVDNAKATYNSTAGGSWSIDPAIFYPTVTVDLYGYAPYDANFKPSTNPATYEFSVAADQSADIRKNDLLTTLQSSVAASTTPLDLTFYHRLSRVEVKFKLPASFKGKPIEGVASIAYKNFRPTAIVDLITAYTYTIDGAATGGTYPKPAEVKAASTPIDITPNAVRKSTPGSTATDGTEYFVYEALVPPQSLASNAGFVEIVVKYTDATTETFYYITSGTPTFVAAKSTVLELSFQTDHTLLLGKVDIAPWVSVTETPGEIVQREVFNKFTINLTAPSATQIAFVTLTTKVGTEVLEYLLPATHTAGSASVACAFDGTQDSPEFYAFDITKIEWFDANKLPIGSNVPTTPVHLSATGPITISL